MLTIREDLSTLKDSRRVSIILIILSRSSSDLFNIKDSIKSSFSLIVLLYLYLYIRLKYILLYISLILILFN